MAALSNNAKKKITKLITIVVDKYLKKAADSPAANSGNPFVMAILKDFEPLIHRIHGLKTSMGNEMEKIAEIIAIDAWGATNVERKTKVQVELPDNVFQQIDFILSNLSNAKMHSDYRREKEEIFGSLNRSSDRTQKHKYEFDLKLYDKKSKKHYFLEMKGPDPNTTEVPGAKRRLLTALAWGAQKYKTLNIDSFIGIYYNNKYPNPYKNPKVLSYFDPAGDLIVHDKFWNFIGKDESTYLELINLFKIYGKKNKNRIWKKFSKLINVK